MQHEKKCLKNGESRSSVSRVVLQISLKKEALVSFVKVPILSGDIMVNTVDICLGKSIEPIDGIQHIFLQFDCALTGFTKFSRVSGNFEHNAVLVESRLKADRPNVPDV